LRKEFGTYLFRGMDSATAPHLLDDSVLSYVSGVDYDSDRGSLKMSLGAAQHIALSGATARGGGVFENDGKVIYKLDQDVKRDGDDFALASGNSNNPVFLPLGDRMYIADSSENRVHDGTSFRDHGAIEPSSQDPEDTYIEKYSPDDMAGIITGISNANPALVTCSGAHGLSTGDGIRIPAGGISGMTQLNARNFKITWKSSTTFELDNEDSTNHTAFSSANNVYRNANGRGSSTGPFKYAVSYQISLPSGDVIESSLIPIERATYDSITFGTEPFDSWNETVRLKLTAPGISVADLSGYTYPAETGEGNGYDIGADIYLWARFWRTKLGGTTFYLIRRVDHALVYNQTKVNCWDDLDDLMLGAAWVEAPDDHDQPPTSSLLAHAGQRLYCNDTSNKRFLYYSQAWAPDFFPPLNNIEIPADITALAAYGDSVLVYSNSRLWRYANLDGVGNLEEIDTPEGTADPLSVVITPFGAVHAGERGLYLYQGVTPKRISNPIQDLFVAETGPWQCCFVDNKLHCYGGGTSVYVATFVGDGAQWSIEATGHGWLFGRPGDASPYTMGENSINKLYSTGSQSLRADTKEWMLPGPARVEYVWIDCKTSGNGLTVTLVYDGGTDVLATNETNSARSLMRFMPSQAHLKQGYMLRVEGEAQIYGMGMTLHD